MKPILKWQYEQIIKELILLQGHEADRTCPCHTEGEECIRKHLLAIEAYAEETIPIEDNRFYREKLSKLALESKEYRITEEKSLCGKAEAVDITEWCRTWRKEFEGYSLACENFDSESE